MHYTVYIYSAHLQCEFQASGLPNTVIAKYTAICYFDHPKGLRVSGPLNPSVSYRQGYLRGFRVALYRVLHGYERHTLYTSDRCRFST